jgi:TRAP-type uncharacterized transport system substrate-binding protein
LVIALISAALSYFIPSPPSTVTIGTAFKGASFDYYGRRYQEKFGLSNVTLDLRATEGALENLRLLKDPTSGVQIAFVTGGVSDREHSAGLLSLGTIDHLPIWIFYASPERLDRLSQLRSKRIAVGPVGSGTRYTAEKILGKGGITSENATLVPLAGDNAAEALSDGEVDVAWILGGADATAVQSLLRNPAIRLMSFPTADAFTRLFPNLAKLTLPQGVIDIAGNIPPNDVSLIATTTSVLVRSDLHPAIVDLLLQTMADIHSAPGIFQHAGEFPLPTDPDYPVAANAIDFYKNGPSFLQRHLPLWLTVHAHRRLLYWYGQLKSLETAIDIDPNAKNVVERQAEVDRIEEAVSRIRFPLAFTNQLYDLRGHIEIVRRRFVPHNDQANRTPLNSQ